MRPILRSRPAAAVLVGAIVALTMTTSYIHLSLGGWLFTLNAAGYAVLAAAILVAAIAPRPIVERFDWFPRLALLGYTAMTIAGYLVMGPYFGLGWLTKGIEVALVGLIVLDVVRVYGGPLGMGRKAIWSVFGDRFPGARPAPAVRGER